MSTNFNDDLGYPYGTFDPRHLMDLYEMIEINGTDLTVQATQREIWEALKDTIKRRNPELIDDDVLDTLDIAADEIAGKELEGDEEMHDYEYEHEGRVRIFMTELGGAPLAYVTASDWITWCNVCSPCVPGAGNLEEPGMMPGSAALCLEPVDMQFLANELGCAYVLRNINSGELQDIQPQKEAESDPVLQQ